MLARRLVGTLGPLVMSGILVSGNPVAAAGAWWPASRPAGLNASGPRAALLVGISDYPGEDEDLGGGPLNDVRLMRDLLVTQFGFAQSEVLTLTDSEATVENIVRAFLGHLAAVPEDGTVVFFYSGHGSQLPDDNGDEADGKDEVLVTLGNSSADLGVIRDDDLAMLAGTLRTRNALFILDACYTGTGTRAAMRDRTTSTQATAPILALLTAADSSQSAAPFKRMSEARLASLLASSASAAMAGTALSQPGSHVLIAASTDQQTAINMAVPLPSGGTARVGLLTLSLYALFQEPRTISLPLTQVGVQLRARARTETARMRTSLQSPQVEGTQQSKSLRALLGTGSR